MTSTPAVTDVLAGRVSQVTLQVLGAVFALRHCVVLVAYVVLVSDPGLVSG